MIKSFKSKALKLYFDKEDASNIQPHHINRVKVILGLLHVAESPADLGHIGFNLHLHLLQPPSAGIYSVCVNGNFRITFHFVDRDVEDVDYLDYH